MAAPPPSARRRKGVNEFAREQVASPLLAAAALVSSPEDMRAEADAAPHGAALVRAKQREVLGMYWMLGELWYTGNFYKQALSRVRLRLGVMDEDGSRVPVFVEDGEVREGVDATAAKNAQEVLRKLRPAVGTQQQLLGQAGLILALTGEGHLVGRDMPQSRFGLTRAYDFRSILEFFPVGDGVYRYVRAPGDRGEDVARGAAHVVRIWNPDAAYGDLADAAPLALRDIMEELVLLTQQVRGEALSRISTAGVLLVAEELDDPDDEEASEQDAEGDAFTRDIIKHGTAAISDKGSAAGVFPYIARVPAQYIKDDAAMRYIPFVRDSDEKAMAKRAEAVRRFAQGMDLPVEIVEGHMSTTFANAAQIDEDLYKVHIEPKCEMLVAGLTTGYLWAVLNDDTFVIDYDASELVAQPDRSAEFAEAHKDYVVSDAARRRAIGASEEDAPDDEEIAARIAIAQAIRVTTRVMATEEQVQATDDEIGPGPDAPLPPDPTTDTPTPPLNAAAVVMQAVIETTVNRAVFWTERRLRARVNRSAEMKASMATVPDSDLAGRLGGDTVQTMLTGDMWANEFDAGLSYLRTNLELTDEEERVVVMEMRRLADARLFSPLSDAAVYRPPA